MRPQAIRYASGRGNKRRRNSAAGDAILPLMPTSANLTPLLSYRNNLDETAMAIPQS